MKTNFKKIMLGASLAILGISANAQNTSLQGIIVEKYYVANAADAAGSTGVLPVGSVAYRVYVDMFPNCQLIGIEGNANHELRVSTTTTFF